MPGVSIIVWAVGSMAALGLLFGLGLVVANRILSTAHDPLVEEAFARLPGINCGACGYKGCGPYSEAVAAGEKVSLCVLGGQDVARELAELMGVEVGQVHEARAVVHCRGGTDRCGDRFHYVGPQDCRAAHITYGGPRECLYGCLGFGTCVGVCPFDAISMNEHGLPVVESQKCTACGICVRECPRGLLSLLDRRYSVYLGCATHQRGKLVKDICSAGCIACGLCAKKYPNGAITMVDNLPALDFEKAGGDFQAACEICPADCFVTDAQAAEPVVAALEAGGRA